MAYREVLEVGKWTAARDVARWRVNSTWRRVLESEELWRVLQASISTCGPHLRLSTSLFLYFVPRLSQLFALMESYHLSLGRNILGHVLCLRIIG